MNKTAQAQNLPPSIQKKKIVFIVGPTGVGKSAVAVEISKRLNGEIVSCDSMQVYREAVITSDRPSEMMLSAVRHHLIGVISVEEEFNAARYREMAVKAIEGIWKEGRLPVVCGGSGMYMMALLDGLFDEGEADPAIRERLEASAVKEGTSALHRRLSQVDPESAKKISANDLKRIIRALEVFESTGVPISTLQKERDGLWGKHDIRVFCLNRSREELYHRVEVRVEEMFGRGIVKEVEMISAKKLASTATRFIGVPEVQGYLAGDYNIDRAKYLIKMNTRHYVKRQLTWFRKDTRLQWVNIAENESAAHVAERIEILNG